MKDKNNKASFHDKYIVIVIQQIYHHIPHSYYFLIHLNLLSFIGSDNQPEKYGIVQSHALFHFIDEIPTQSLLSFFERVRT